jgi:hypothetical protein
LTVGFIAGIKPSDQRPPFVENLGAIRALPSDSLFLSTQGSTNVGVLHIGSSNGLAACAHFTQTANGTLELDAAGTIPGTDHGQLKIGGNGVCAVAAFLWARTGDG